MWKRLLILMGVISIVLTGIDQIKADEGLRLEGTLLIPSLEMYRPIVFIPLKDRDYNLTELNYRVGHLDQTSWVNEPGKLVLVGHTPGAFNEVKDIEVGALIHIQTSCCTATYVVTNKYLVGQGEWGVLAAPPGNRQALISLITCTNDLDYRLVVDGVQVEMTYYPEGVP